MDSRGEPPQSQPPQGMVGVLGHASSYAPATTTTHPTSMINPNSSLMQTHRFPFNTMVGPSQQPAPPPPPPSASSEHLDSLGNAGIYGGSSPAGFAIEPAKKKRGRPRKYTPEGNIALGLGPTSVHTSSADHHHHHHQHHHHNQQQHHGHGDGGDGVMTGSSEPQTKKHRGRPPGVGKKQLDALGAGGVGFTPHVILVKAGEDVASKIIAFSQQGPRTVCILAANGAICNVTLRQPTTGGTVTYEGRFEIICITGSFLSSETEGNRLRSSGLSVSLAGPDGRVLGGGVAGMLIAATPVQVIVGSFIVNGKKSSSNTLKSDPSSTPQGPQSHMLNFNATGTAVSPSSQGASGESSDENGNSPIHRTPGLYNDANQPMHNMQMYHHLWAGHTQ